MLLLDMYSCATLIESWSISINKILLYFILLSNIVSSISLPCPEHMLKMFGLSSSLKQVKMLFFTTSNLLFKSEYLEYKTIDEIVSQVYSDS
jgi:hypothetical protein